MQITPHNFNTPFKTAKKEPEAIENNWEWLLPEDAELTSKMQGLDLNAKDEFVASAKLDAADTPATKKMKAATTQITEGDAKQEEGTDLTSKMQGLDLNAKDEFVASAKLDAAGTQATKTVKAATTQTTEEDAKREWDKRWGGVNPAYRLSWGTDPNGTVTLHNSFYSTQKRILEHAIEENYLPYVLALLDSGADPNKPLEKYEGKPPSQSALGKAITDECNLPIIQALLAHGADPNADVDVRGDKYSRTLLHYAVKKENLAVMQALLAHGADPNKADSEGKTPLHYATESYHHKAQLPMVLALLAHGADPNKADNKDKTPLLNSIKEFNLGSIQALLAHGADPNQPNSDGKTALDVAFIEQFHDGKDLLRLYNAEESGTVMSIEEARKLALSRRWGSPFLH